MRARRSEWAAITTAALTCVLLLLGTSLLQGSSVAAAIPRTGVSCSTTTAISYGSNSISGSIASAGADACFTFTTAPGDVVWLNMAKTTGDLSLFDDFFRPGPISTCAGPYGGSGACPVPAGGSGAWVLQVSDSSGTHTGAFRLSIQRLNVGVGCTNLKFGKDLDAQIPQKAASTCFTFTATPGEFLFARGTGTSGKIGTPSAIVATATGAEPCIANGTIECPLTTSGTQTLLLYSESGTTKGSFVLYTQQMTAQKHCTTLTAGGPKESGSVAHEGDFACFVFSGASGDTETVTLSSLTGTLDPLIDFFEPTGPSACASPALAVSCTLDKTGTWTVLVNDDLGPGTGTFQAALTKT